MFHQLLTWIRRKRQTLLTNQHVDPVQLAYVVSRFDGYDWSRFSPEGLIEWLQPQALQPLHVRAIGIEEPGLFGAWLVTTDEPGDHFFYKAGLPRIHQVAVILHEVAHFLWRHETEELTTAELEAITAGNVLNLQNLPGVCRRAGEESISRADWEAETTAHRLFARYISARMIQPVDSGLQRVLQEEV